MMFGTFGHFVHVFPLILSNIEKRILESKPPDETANINSPATKGDVLDAGKDASSSKPTSSERERSFGHQSWSDLSDKDKQTGNGQADQFSSADDGGNTNENDALPQDNTTVPSPSDDMFNVSERYIGMTGKLIELLKSPTPIKTQIREFNLHFLQ